MNFPLTLLLVLLATYGLASLLLSALVALAWRAGLGRRLAAPHDLLALRLLPTAGGTLVALTIVLPAFILCEPAREPEAVGPLLAALALLGLAMLGDGLRRARRASARAQALLRAVAPADSRRIDAVPEVAIIDVADPIVAVVGSWRPRIISARCVVAACSADEFREVIAHERAHLSARDNLKLLLLLACADGLAWSPLGRELENRWRIAAELDADERAAGPDPRRRVALASALVKVARLSGARGASLPALSLSVAADDIGTRVRQLLAPSPRSRRGTTPGGLVAGALLVPLAAAPAYEIVQRLIEALVAFGL